MLHAKINTPIMCGAAIAERVCLGTATTAPISITARTDGTGEWYVSSLKGLFMRDT